MKIEQLDHLVLTVKNINISIEFYTQILGMQLIKFGENRKALKFGSQKINLHEARKELHPHANTPTCGSADLCFIVETQIEKIQLELSQHRINIEQGPIERTGTSGPIISLYIRDPDNNLIELSNRM